MFFEPGFEGCIFGRGGGVAAAAGVADAEELFLDGREAVEIVFDSACRRGGEASGRSSRIMCTPCLWSCQCDAIVAQSIPKIGMLSQWRNCQRIQFIERPIKYGAAPMPRKS